MIRIGFKQLKIQTFWANSALFVLALSVWALTARAEAPRGEPHEVRVRLFGNECILRGPYEPATLSQIHSVSPATVIELKGDLPLDEAITEKSARDALARILGATTSSNSNSDSNKDTKLPSELKNYLDLMQRKLRGIVAFFEGLRPNPPKVQIQIFRDAVQPYMSATAGTKLRAEWASRLADFKFSQKRLATTRALKGQELLLFQTYLSVMDPAASEPDDAFHRAIQKLGVQYVCDFDTGATDSVQPESAREPTPSRTNRPSP